MYFSMYNGSSGKTELWKIDGTPASPVLVAALTSSSSTLGELTAVGTEAYFTIDGSLWHSDGTAGGTSLLLDLIPGSIDTMTELTALGDALYFSARDTANLTDLYQTDGTTAGTERLTSANLRPNALTAADQTLYFHGFAGDGAGEELWKSDGTAGGTARVTDLRPGLLSSVFGATAGAGRAGVLPRHRSAPGRRDVRVGRHIRGTAMVRDYNEGLMNAKIEHAPGSDGSMYYGAMHNYSNNIELLRADGTPGGAGLVKEIYSTTTIGSLPETLTNVNGTIYFTANHRTSGRELWKSDGTDAGTVMVKEMSPKSASTEITEMRASGNTLYFYARPTGSGNPLHESWYKTDGTDAGTVAVGSPPVGTTAPGGSAPAPTDLKVATAPSGWTYFADFSNFGQLYLKRSKGGVTQTVGTWNYSGGGSSPSYPRGISFVGTKVVFAAADNTYGIEPWAYDESTNTTYLLRNMVPDGGGIRLTPQALPPGSSSSTAGSTSRGPTTHMAGNCGGPTAPWRARRCSWT